jgi:benzaldehyde dehydrogenase (NAD)
MVGAPEISNAAAAARKAQPNWAATPFEKRAAILRSAAQLCSEHVGELARWIVRETGSTQLKAEFEVAITTRCLHEAAAMPSQPQGLVLPSNDGSVSFCRRQPLGVVGVITPFNFPLYLNMRAVAPALAVGNSVVLKPDPRTPITGGFVLAQIFESVGLPDDVLHVLPGGVEAGEALCVDPNLAMIQFTGSGRAGRRVGELAGGHLKKLSLELGGKNSLVILDDADLDLAASNAAWGAYLHQGQICMASGRILVQRKIEKELTERLVEKAKHTSTGDERGSLGPLISKQQLDRVAGIVRDSVSAGAKLMAGGATNGLFFEATVLSGVAPGMPAFDAEIFGPVVALTAFDTDDEAVELANRTDYGLSAAVISRSVALALAIGSRLRSGLLHINAQTVADDVVNPFGGRGISGNGTSIGGPANWTSFLNGNG